MLKFNNININKLNRLSRKLSLLLEPSDIIGFTGNLGAGKTTLIRLLASQFGIVPRDVVSPTFILFQTYDGKYPLYHWDLYRLKNEKELYDLDYEEYFFGGGISFIEWFDKLETLKPESYLKVSLESTGEEERNIIFEGVGVRGKALVKRLGELDWKI